MATVDMASSGSSPIARRSIPSSRITGLPPSSGPTVGNNRRDLDALDNPSAKENSSGNIHTLRSSRRYQHSVEYRLRPAGLMKAFNDVYIPFRDGHTIPETARHTLDAFTLTSDQYYSLITDRELPRGQFISLDNGKLIFNEYTLPPHGEVIMEIGEQISVQNRPKLFQASTGENVNLAPGNDKQPDGQWTLIIDRLPNPQQAQGVFAINMATNKIAPQLVLEVAVGNESMPQLTITDLNRYFGPGTGTRCWIGLKIFKTTNGNHRWWAGIAYRARAPNGTLLDAPDTSPESMPIVASHNTPITTPTNIIFHVDVATLIDPCQPPPNYPATFNIDLEEIRRVIVQWI